MPGKISFLDIIRSKTMHGQGSRPQNGSGLPTGLPGNFMFATGIECSYPLIDHGKTRRDLLEECGHYTYWRKDLQLVKELGLKVLRYGLPYYSIHTGPGKYDWSFADEVMGEMKNLGITPILDLMHFGLPEWLGDFQNPELPIHFADYADAVSQRYPWVRFYTPVNEIYITARASAKDGIWNEQLKSDRAFVTAMKHVAAACILAIHRIARNRPDCVIVQSETAEFIHDLKAVPSEEIKLQNKLRFLSLDFLYAHSPDADVCLYLMDNGLSREEFDWFMTNSLPCYQVMGNDYYGRNEKIALPDGSMCEATDVMGWYQITRKYYDRYKRPVMHTETNVFSREDAPTWLWKQWVNVMRMRGDGVPVIGFTWYSLTDQIDWDISLREKKGTVNPVGLYDLDRKPTPVAASYRALLKEFGLIPIIHHGEMLEITDRPAKINGQKE